jgi:dihydrofolate reductase
MHRISLIAAIGATTRVLGKDNDLVWDIPEDLERFRNLTRGHPVVMGRKTWESIPAERRPLPKRANIVITRQKGYDAPGAAIVGSVKEALESAKRASGSDEIFIIGGSGVFEEALPVADRLYLTLVHDEASGDVYFPEYAHLFPKEIEREEHLDHTPPFTYVTLEK